MARASIVRLVAPPLGGALFGLAHGLPFVVDAISYAFSSAAMLLMRVRFQEEREPGARVDLREGLEVLLAAPVPADDDRHGGGQQLRRGGRAGAVIILAHRHGLSSAAIGGSWRFGATCSRARCSRRCCAGCCRCARPARRVLGGPGLRRLHRRPERVRARASPLRSTRSGSRHRLGDDRLLVPPDPRPTARAGRWPRRTPCGRDAPVGPLAAGLLLPTSRRAWRSPCSRLRRRRRGTGHGERLVAHAPQPHRGVGPRGGYLTDLSNNRSSEHATEGPGGRHRQGRAVQGTRPSGSGARARGARRRRTCGGRLADRWASSSPTSPSSWPCCAGLRSWSPPGRHDRLLLLRDPRTSQLLAVARQLLVTGLRDSQALLGDLEGEAAAVKAR